MQSNQSPFSNLDFERVNISTLNNGLRVVTYRMPGAFSVATGLWIHSGSRQETTENNGIAHMLEHMAFKGTTSRNAKQIAEMIENVGGYINAYTSRAKTAYYTRLLKQDLPLGIELIADILQNPTFTPEEIEREKQVICQEIYQTYDTPDDIVFDYLQKISYPDHSFGMPILGSAENVKSFNAQHLRAYMQQNYHTPNMVLVAVGAVEHDEVVALAERHWGGYRATVSRPSITAPQFQAGHHNEHRDIEQVHIVLGFPGLDYHHPDYYKGSLLSTVLGGGMSSRLFQDIRERHGLVYSIYAFSSSYEDNGMLGIYAGTSPEHVPTLFERLRQQILNFAPCQPEELARAKAQLKAGILMGRESVTNRAESIAKQMLIFKRPLSAEEVIEGIDAVTTDDIDAVAHDLLQKQKPAIASVGAGDRDELGIEMK